MESLHLVVGLGNPGAGYARTRHNAGFLVVEELARRASASWNLEKKFEARVAKADRAGRKMLFAQPQTFMNASGEAVGALMNFYRVPVGQLLVIVDDADLPFGEIRLRAKGSSGGHHGLESIEKHIGSREFARLKVGIGRTQDGRREITNYVLGKFNADEAKLLEKVLRRAADQTECWCEHGVEKAMNQFNGVVNSERNEA
ncbi:MAG TPA: aminoacyl-tRNA hydrolase [Candidatus Limnocylindria bacterium]|nr:aminoacyl-tRNA hydrolase [Candidatus Limnocylindria bacterium]